ncbi:hypothetical protein Gotur_020566, partial [Gossypium turneri]
CQGSYRALRGCVNGLGYPPVKQLVPYLELARFKLIALTWTECTVTLEYVAFQLGLPIDGNAVMGVSKISESTALCYNQLGVSSGDAESKFTSLKFSWLKANFEHLSINATKHEVMCTARVYIMHIIGDVLIPDANNNKVHLMYLLLLTDFHNVRSYSWGSAVLAMLYCELCRTTKPSVVDIGGCLILL